MVQPDDLQVQNFGDESVRPRSVTRRVGDCGFAGHIGRGLANYQSLREGRKGNQDIGFGAFWHVKSEDLGLLRAAKQGVRVSGRVLRKRQGQCV